ncbi:MAG: carboxypeptidase-like regulatory domain-containing protein [Bacteroidales bacterium]|nr:carboxypeptidase-like regulatory domain-containing protein [Bacteroidales bacterium]
MAFIFLQTILNNASAQNSSIPEAVVKGIVVDSASQLPLEFATIILMKGDKDVVKTDMSAMDGTFKLTTNKDGKFYPLCFISRLQKVLFQRAFYHQ